MDVVSTPTFLVNVPVHKYSVTEDDASTRPEIASVIDLAAASTSSCTASAFSLTALPAVIASVSVLTESSVYLVVSIASASVIAVSSSV